MKITFRLVQILRKKKPWYEAVQIHRYKVGLEINHELKWFDLSDKEESASLLLHYCFNFALGLSQFARSWSDDSDFIFQQLKWKFGKIDPDIIKLVGINFQINQTKNGWIEY